MTKEKHWTPQRIILLVLAIGYIVYKLMNEQDIPVIGAMIVILIAGSITVIYFKTKKKGIFVEK